jgi:two-component system cell cycle response regulator CpdR
VREPNKATDRSDATAGPDTIAAGLEHDLSNALAAIIGFSQVIRRDPALPEELHRSADLLVDEATRTRRLVGELLAIVRERPTDGAIAAAGAPSRTSPTRPSSTTSAASETAVPTAPSVLVLEDEPSIRVFLEKALKLLGYEPVITAVGPDAIELAATGNHAALLFDHRMKGMSGAEAYEAVVALRPDLAGRIVMMSGELLDPAVEAFAATHAVTLLAKPFDIDTLDRAIRAVMAATGQVRG